MRGVRMKKIKVSFMLLVLLSSLGLQTTTALASTSEQGDLPEESLEQPPNGDLELPIIELPNEEEPSPVEQNPTEIEQPAVSDEPTEPVLPPREEKPKKIVQKDSPVVSTSETVPSELPVYETAVEEVVHVYQQGENYSEPTFSNGSMKMGVAKNTQEFVDKIGEQARTIGQEHKLYASVMIAQAILESASGQSDLASPPNYNLFGIKGAYKEQSVSFLTSEDDGVGSLYNVQAKFRQYSSYKESLEDYADLMVNGIEGNPTFYYGVSKTEATSYKEATQFLTGKYATDITYNQKLNGLIDAYNLTSFDYEKKLVVKKIDGKEIDSYSVMNPINNQSSNFIIPLDSGYIVTSSFGERDTEHHDGIDLAVPNGTPIYVSNDGVVVQTGFGESAGNYVIVEHENGLFTNYFHMSEITTTADSNVKTGDVIGFVGSTGNSTGSHLHFGLSQAPWQHYLNPNYLFSINYVQN